ncbi:hypothetical protein ACFX2C_014754 [Malus domestica]
MAKRQRSNPLGGGGVVGVHHGGGNNRLHRCSRCKLQPEICKWAKTILNGLGPITTPLPRHLQTASNGKRSAHSPPPSSLTDLSTSSRVKSHPKPVI